MQRDCLQLQTNINIAFSGTTSVFGVLVRIASKPFGELSSSTPQIEKKLYVCNIGDSRCVLCRQAPDGEIQSIGAHLRPSVNSAERSTLLLTGLSFDQKPENPNEKARILKAGGRVEPLPGAALRDCRCLRYCCCCFRLLPD